MGNSFNISVAPQVAAVQAAVNANAVVTTDIHDVDLPAVKTVVDNVYAARLSDEEKSILGIGVIRGFRDDFNTVDHGADPDTDIWSVVENGAGDVEVQKSSVIAPGYCLCNSLAGVGDDAIAYTKGKWEFAFQDGVSLITLKARLRMNWTSGGDGECGIGFLDNASIPANVAALSVVANYAASIVADTGVPRAHTTDNTNIETTDLSAFITDAVWFDLIILMDGTDVKFYIGGTLRATHTTRVPDGVWQVMYGATQVVNANNTVVEHIEVVGT